MLPSLLGGVLIGVSASLAHAGARRTAGVSGALGSLLRWPLGPRGFSGWFVIGLLLGGLALASFAPPSLPLTSRSLSWLVLAGLLVGYGTRLGSGCTSGHAVCGISRLSVRSLAATVTFMATAVLVVFVVRHVVPAAGVQP
jgi:uncharacterized membrane protein YedE/YeeE